MSDLPSGIAPSPTVWKFDLPLGDVVTLHMPYGAQVLHVAAQFGQPQLWARVTPGPLQNRCFRIAGTGHPLEHPAIPDFDTGDYVGSFMLQEGALVFHVFEEASPF